MIFRIIFMEHIPELSWGEYLLELKCILPGVLHSLLGRGVWEGRGVLG
ncbi:hypothetical protein J2129_002130 [Methanofollis sp. W23]|nr:hypothetical protein [Methanofollis sp. W23]